jgi:ElaB/YqjD/DUF883 family membrane-anchored ribosome-binding protein
VRLYFSFLFFLYLPNSFLTASFKQELGILFELTKFKQNPFTMDNREKLHVMEKMLRELDDIVNSQTSLLKKVAQLEAENINLGNRILEKQLPEIHSKADETLTVASQLQEEFTDAKDKFIKDNKLDEVLPEAT